MLRSAVTQGATEKQLNELRTAATARKQTLLGAQA